MTLPGYNFLPAPLWLITTLHIVTLTLHFLAMNFLLGGLIVVLFARINNKWNDPAVRSYVKLLPTAMAATVTLGVAPLLFLQLVYYQQVYAASIVSAWPWILIVAAVIVGYYLLYGSAFRIDRRGGRVAPMLVVALPLLLYVSLVYSTVFSMAERPEWTLALYQGNQSGWVVNSDASSWVLRWLHMVVGAITVGGFFVGLVGRWSERLHRTGRAFFLWGTVVSVLLGGAYMLTLGDLLLPFMRSPAIWLVMVSLVLSIAAVFLYFKGKFVTSGVTLALSLAGMVVVRHILRLLVLEGRFDPSTIPVSPQWSVFALFLLCFVLAVGLIAYMLRLYFAAERGQAT